MNRELLSVVVTTLNNATTLERCLASVQWADEIVVLDSGSSDHTAAIAAKYRARWFVEPFKGYGPQKMSALDKATYAWALLLDADEALTDESAAAIRQALIAPTVHGFTLPRREQIFWRLQHAAVRHNPMLRLFQRGRVRFSSDPIHAAPETDGPIAALAAPFVHYGEPDIHTKVDKVNSYSTGMVAAKQAKGQRFTRLRMVFYPPWHFFRVYVLKRKFLSGWAGFIGAAVDAFYVFLKYAKLYERRQRRDDE